MLIPVLLYCSGPSLKCLKESRDHDYHGGNFKLSLQSNENAQCGNAEALNENAQRASLKLSLESNENAQCGNAEPLDENASALN